MTSIAATVDKYIATWNEPDAERRAALAAEVWTEDGTYLDPLMRGEGPDEIAVAIAGELLAVRNEREAGFLRTRKGPIHDRNRLQAVAPG
jgi:hypothetical protein